MANFGHTWVGFTWLCDSDDTRNAGCQFSWWDFLTNRISVVRTNGFPPFFTPKHVGVIDILFVCFVCDADMLRQGISHLHKPTPRCHQSCTSWNHLLSLFTARDFRLLLKGNLRGRAHYVHTSNSKLQDGDGFWKVTVVIFISRHHLYCLQDFH